LARSATQGELGDILHSYFRALPNFHQAFREILVAVLQMERDKSVCSGAVLWSRRKSGAANGKGQVCLQRDDILVKEEEMSQTPKCWCGNSDLVTFSSEYLRCKVCETLIAAHMPEYTISRVTSDEQDFYGCDYWFSHQEEELGNPSITARARADLPERCLHWLRALLKYKLPPAHVLELGSAHGGFVAMLRLAGFDATGLELSPWVVKFASEIFNVPMLLGPLEDQQIDPGSLDVIALMDVLEHLPDPLGTMRHCLGLLKPEGILVIQTPQYPEGKTCEDMVSQHDRFLEQLKEKEHLYLFSPKSIRELFHRLAAEHLAFEPAIFAHYDMFLVVSRAPLAAYLPDEIDRALEATPSGRMVQALLALDNQLREFSKRYAESEADRAARLEDMHRIERLLAESERDRAARRGVIEAQRAEIGRLQEQVVLLSQRLETLVQGIRSNRIYKILRKMGRWKWLSQILQQPITIPKASDASQLDKKKRQLRSRHKHGKKATRIAVDLTPLLPGGGNGGAKIMAIGLIQNLSKAAPEWEFVLLTSSRSHDELAILDSRNVQRICAVQHNISRPSLTYHRVKRLRIRLQELLAAILPAPLFTKLKSIYRSMPHRTRAVGLLRQLEADLLLCPFTAPSFFHPTVPVVSVVHDLSYRYYPQFYNSNELSYRDISFKDACRIAQTIVCVSDYTRKTVLENADVNPELVITIYTRLNNRLTRQPCEKVAQLLNRFDVEEGRFLLYPSNFWPHKNHLMLLTVFGMYKTRHPESDLRLVLTGVPDARMERLQYAAQRMGLAERVIFPGYVSDEELAVLLQSCLALIFPSLFEGFGMPILEAMAFNRPVLCSNTTSIPEIAGEAALFFDPKKPKEILNAIENIESDTGLVKQLIERGQQRLAAFGDTQEMTRQYLQLFRQVMGPKRFSDALNGVYPDGWTTEHVIVTYGASQKQRSLEIKLTAPPWLPSDRVSAIVTQNGQARSETYLMERGQAVTISRTISHDGGFIDLSIAPVWQPKAYGQNEDERMLGCICQACRIISPGAIVNLLEKEHN